MTRTPGTRPLPRSAVTPRSPFGANQAMPPNMQRAQQRIATAQHPRAQRPAAPFGRSAVAADANPVTDRTQLVREQNDLLRQQNEILSTIADRLLSLLPDKSNEETEAEPVADPQPVEIPEPLIDTGLMTEVVPGETIG